MINIIVQDKQLILSPDTAIKIELVFPDPTKDNLPNSVVQWFNIPAIQENDEILNFVKYIEISNKIRVYENVYLEASGISKKGTLIVKSATNGSYKVSITFNPFSQNFKDTLLQKLDLATYSLGSDTDAIIATAKSYSQLEYPNTDMVFPMINMGNFYGTDINESFLYFINYYLNGAFLKNIEVLDQSGNINCLVPHFYLLSALEAIFSEVDYNVSGKFFEDTDIMKLIIFNNYALDKLRFNYVVKTWTTSVKQILRPPSALGYIGLWTDEETDNDNCYDPVNGIYEFKAGGSYNIDINMQANLLIDFASGYLRGSFAIKLSFSSSSIEDITFPYYFDQYHLGLPFNISESVNLFLDSSEINSTVTFFVNGMGIPYHLENGEIVEDPSEDVSFSYENVVIDIVPFSYNNKNVFEPSVSMQNHLPNISVSEFVNNLVKLYSLAVFTDENNNIEFTFWKDILANNNLLDLTEYYIKDSDELEVYKNIYALKMPFSDDEIDKRAIDGYTVLNEILREDIPVITKDNQVYYLKDLNRWIMSYFDFTTNTFWWKPYRDNFKNINDENSAAKDIEIKVNTLQMHFEGYPVSLLSGSSPEFGLGKTDFPFKLLFYHGIIPGVNYTEMPYASSNKFKPDGSSGSNHSLRLNDVDGIYDKYSKEYYEYAEETDINTVDLNINEKILADIVKLFSAGSDTRKIRIVNRNYLPVKIDIEIGMNGIKSCRAKLR